jgi:hypothetical protein
VRGVGVRAFPGLNHPSDEDLSLGTPVKSEISTPRTKTCSRGHEKDKGRAEADGEVGAVADGADDLRRKRVAEAVNEKRFRDGGGADRGSD